MLGAPEPGDAPQHAVTSAAMMTQRDPWVNMLRTTLAAFGAGLGGADEVTVAPFDAALPPGALGVSRSFANRMAVNTQLLLLEESHLGRVLDPGAGSWYVESLTDATAQAAWDVFTGIEAQGATARPWPRANLAAAIAAVRDRRADDVAHRRHAITGVSEFPDVAEKPARIGNPRRVLVRSPPRSTLRDPPRPVGRPPLRDGVPPDGAVGPIGSLAEYTPRTTFTVNLLGAAASWPWIPVRGRSGVRRPGHRLARRDRLWHRQALRDEAGDTVAVLRAPG